MNDIRTYESNQLLRYARRPVASSSCLVAMSWKNPKQFFGGKGGGKTRPPTVQQQPYPYPQPVQPMAPMIPMPVPHALAPAQPSGEEQAITSMLVEGLQEIRQREQKDGFAKVLGNVLTRCIGGSSSSRDDRDRDRDNVGEKNFGMLRKLRRALNREDSDVVRKGSSRSRSKSRRRSRSRRQRSSSRGRNQGCSSGSKQCRDSACDRSKRRERSTSSDGSWYEEMRAHYKREKAACKQTSPKLKLLERLPTKNKSCQSRQESAYAFGSWPQFGRQS